jgi:hypothetical protein
MTIQPQDYIWFPAITGRPAGQAARAGYLGQKIIEVPIAKVASSGTSNATDPFQVRIINPSRRLGCGFAVLFKPDTAQTVADWPSSTWTPIAFDPIGGEFIHELESAIALPRMYELESYVPGVIVQGTLGVPTDAAAATVPGMWLLRVRWEPCIPMCDEEAQSIYAACSASLDYGSTAVLTP